jgi:hypothetical protein
MVATHHPLDLATFFLRARSGGSRTVLHTTQMKMVNCVCLLALTAVFLGFVGCGNSTNVHEEWADDEITRESGHEAHEPQNGGVPIVIGDDEFHLELVHKPGESLINAYVLDGHMENYVRLHQSSFEIRVRAPKPERTLVFQAVANRATGEVDGDTALFQADEDWLKTMTSFEGVISLIEIRSKTFQNVEFNFPEGNDH